MSTETERPLKIFLSYASQDKPVIRRLSLRLIGEGWIDTWFDEKKLFPGQDWRLKIEDAVETSDIVIICLSTDSVSKAGYVQKELRYAREISLEKPEETIFLIPLRLDECDVPRGLRFFQWVDYFGEKKDESYEMLLESLRLRYYEIIRFEKREAAKKAAKEKAKKEATQRAAREKTKKETAKKAAREKAEKEIAEKAAREKAEKEDAEKVAREQAEKEVSSEEKQKETATPEVKKTLLSLKWSWKRIIISIILIGLGLSAIFGLPSLFTQTESTPEPTLTEMKEVTLETSATVEITATAKPPSTPSITTTPIVVLPSETPTSQEYKVGYFVAQEGGLDLFVADMTGDSSYVGEELSANNRDIAVSGNGQYIAESKDGYIYYLDILTGEEFPLIYSVFQRDYKNLAWADDGKYVFAVVQGSNSNWSDGGWTSEFWLKTYIVNTINLSLTEISNRAGYRSFKNISWSPDNEFIAFWEARDIFFISPETGKFINATTNGTVSDVPFDWSPDGKYIIFAMTNSDAIYLLDLDTEEHTPLIDNAGKDIQDISWNPDGEKIAYSALNKIYIYDTVNTETIFVADGEKPVWSPDGAMLLFLHDRDVFVINSDGTEKTDISNSPAINEINPFWVDTSSLFDIATDEIIKETAASSYTYCTWGYWLYWGTGKSWTEYSCSCSAGYCTCKRTDITWMDSSSWLRSAVDSSVKKYNGTCVYIVDP